MNINEVNEVSIPLVPEVIVIVPDVYDVTQVPLPSELADEVTWLCNFKITENCRKPTKQFRYQIQVYPIRHGKKLVYFDDTEKDPRKQVKPVENQVIIKKNNKSYMQGDLDLPDPPIGWV